MKKFEKPVVPQYVADWYEENKDNFEDNLAYLLNDYLNEYFAFIEDSNLKEWLDKDFNLNKPIQTLVNMHQFGYKVEKEKLYTVEIPNPNGEHLILCKNKSGKVFIQSVVTEKWEDHCLRANLDTKLTEKEIKKDYASVWQFAKEVEDY